MIATKLIIDNDLQETIPYISAEYPCYTCYEQFDLHPDGKVPWHWHTGVELSYVLKGKMKVLINSEEYILEAGDGMFINSNVLHYKEPASDGIVSTVNHILEPSIVGGHDQSVFSQRYVLPLIDCKSFESCVISQKEEKYKDVLKYIQHAYDVTYRKEYGYEILARNDFSQIWLALFEMGKDKIIQKKGKNTIKEERIKNMMIYIHKNYKEKITLDSIAASTNISKRECLRCFQEVLNMTPFHYLMEYRIRKASEMLRGTKESIAEIGYSCGFSGISYFTKVFRESRGMTPGEYRKKAMSRL